jgi:hypothetical protein
VAGESANRRPGWFSVNRPFRLGTRARGRGARGINDFLEFASGTSSALAECGTNNTAEEDEHVKRINALAILLGTTLLAGVASASVMPSEDIQAPRSSNEDIQAPRSSNEDIQAPRATVDDVQAPRDGQAAHDRNEDIQAPRG